MEDANTSEHPLVAADGVASPQAIEAFSILGNEKRLSILLALWDAYEPRGKDNAVSFSELRNQVGIRDSGQFNYHLDQLDGHFIKRTDAGYELRKAGLELVKAVIAGAGIDEPVMEPVEIDLDCYRCGASQAVTYQDEWLYRVCTECDGSWAERGGGREEIPRGTLAGYPLNPAGLTDRSPEEVWLAGVSYTNNAYLAGIQGVCQTCSGPMERSLRVCSDHEPAGVCDTCGRLFERVARLDCPVCKTRHEVPPPHVLQFHPAVIAFYHEHGIPLQYEIDDFESRREASAIFKDFDSKIISHDPPRIRFDISRGEEQLSLTLTEDLSITDVDRT